MNVKELITEHLDIWTSALKVQKSGGRGRGRKANGHGLYGIKKLRELILDLAVRGKLVEQDPEDEPASVLLEKIAEEKARLIKEGKIKKQKKLPEITEEGKPFDLPEGWEWVRLGNVGDWGAGSTPDRKNPDYYEGNMPWFKSGELNDNEHLKNSEETVTKKALKCCSLRICIHGDVLIAMYGATIGMLAILENIATTNQAVCACTCHLGVFNRYLFLTLKAWRMKFAGQGAGGAQPNISKVKIVNTVVPLPPLNEQHRIVAKVDELMALCDQLEQQQTTNNATHQTLLQTLLSTLTNSADAEDFSTAWERIASHFDILFTTEQSIDQLQQTLLQLAVMGKLVPQNPKDEPASVLLGKIAKEKARLIKEGKIKKQKKLPEISEETKPFELPEGWVFAQFDKLMDITSGVTKGRKLQGRTLVSVPYLRVANVQRGFLDLGSMKEIDIPEDELGKFTVKERDLLITEGGDWDKVGRTTIWGGELPLVAHQNHIFKARCILAEQNEVWMEKSLNSPFARDYFAKSSKQTTNLASINKTQLRGVVIPIPPLAEQYRIVTKVDELIFLCDQLKERLHNNQTTKLQLADTLVKQAVA